MIYMELLTIGYLWRSLLVIYTNANGNWYTFNDTMVQNMNTDKLISPNAYCLFYKKIN